MLLGEDWYPRLVRFACLLGLLTLMFWLAPCEQAMPGAHAAGDPFFPAAVTDQTPTAPLANPVASSYQPRYISGFGLDNSFTVFFEDRDAGSTISYASTTTGPTGFPASATATNIADTHFVIKDWPITVGATTYAYRAWGSVGNDMNHHFYVSNDLTNWTLVSTFTISNDLGFTGANGYVYYGFHDVILLNGTYYAFAESNQSQTMIVRSANGDDVWEAFASVGGRTGDGPLELPSGVTAGWTPSGTFVDLGHDRGYGKIYADPRDNNFYLAINLAAKPSLSPAALEAAFINPANWTWHDGTTGPASNPILSATAEHDLRECWVVPNTDPDADWVIVYDADFGSGDGGKALGYATLSPPRPSTVWVDDDYDAASCSTAGHNWQYDCFDSIQDGIDAVSGSIVNVAAGTYNERITIDKSLELRGAQYGVDPTPSGSRTGDESIITEAGISPPNPDVLIEIPSGVTNVTVDGFTLNGNQTNTVADTSVLRVWDDDITIRNNIIDGMRGVIFKGSDNLTFDQNHATVNKGGVVVQPNPASAVTVSDNVFVVGSNPQGDMSGAYATGCTGCSFTGNTVTGFNGRGLGGSSMTSTTISGNTLSGNRDGVSWWGNTTFMTISDNEIDGSTRHGITVKGQDLTISGNQITNSTTTGINVEVDAIPTERVVISTNEIGGGGGGGIYLKHAMTNLQIVDNWIHDLGGDAVAYAGAATVSGVHEVQGNLFQNNGGDGVNNGTGSSFDVAYNSWGHYDGPTPDGDGVTGIDVADYTPWTHVALSMASSDSPQADEVGVGHQIKYTVKMDAREVWGADFDLEFDKAKLEVVSISNSGTFDQNTQCKLSTVLEANISGEISFCGDRTTIGSALNGLGQAVFEVVFEGLDPGLVDLDLDEGDDTFGMAPPSGASNNIYAALLDDGSVEVLASDGVSGRIDLQGRADDTGAVMDFAAGAAYSYDYTLSTSDYWGAIGASDVVQDEYGITVSMQRYLDVTGASAKSIIIAGPKALSTLVLWGGDVNNSGAGDGAIDSSDAGIVGGAYGTVPGDTFWNEHADINADSAITISDLVILGGNYGKASATAYVGWTP